MPIVSIDGNEMSLEDKRILIKEITDTVSERMHVPKEAVTIILKPVPHEDIGVGGVILSESREK